MIPEKRTDKDKKVHDLVLQARTVLERSDDPSSLWRAYVAIEYAILDLKLRYGLEHQEQPPAPKRTEKREDLIAAAQRELASVDLDKKSDEKKLLYGLRQCRNLLKASLTKA